VVNGIYKFNPGEICVLVVDDQDQIRKAIRRVLQKMQFQDVLEATNAQAADAVFSARHPSLVICDLNLGETSGFEVLERIRARCLGSDIPVLMVTGESSRDDIIKSVDMGANDYLLKPFQPEDLERKVVKLLDAFVAPEPLLQKIRATEKLLMEGEYMTALHPLGEAIAIEANNPRVRFLHAFAHAKTGRTGIAEKTLEKLISEQPGYFRATALLADLRLAGGRVGEAVRLMERELEYNGKQPGRRVQLAKLLLAQKKSEECIEQCRKALLLDQRMGEALLTMGHGQVLAGNIDKGIYYFKRLRRYHPDSRDALEAIVSTCERIKDLKRAEYALRDERAANPDQKDATVILARVYLMQHKLDEAVAIAGELTNSGAADEANLIMAMAEIKNGRAREALVALEKIRGEQDRAHVCRLRAELNLQLGNPAQAAIEAGKSFAAEPWSERALLIQAAALARIGEHAKACFVLLRASMVGAPAEMTAGEFVESRQRLEDRREVARANASARVAS